MKNLKDILVEKLKVDDITPDVDFPIDEPVKKWIEFLEKYNFTSMRYSSGDGIDGVMKKLNDIKGYGFYYGNMMSENCQFIYIADTTKEKISNNNPYYYYNDKYKEFYRNDKIILKKTFIDEFYEKFRFSY